MSALLRIPGIVCRLVLAAVFLAAGWFKSLDPAGFAQEISQYGILGGSLAQGAAYALIPFELALGTALLVNWRPRVTHAVAGGLLLLFIGAIGFALATGKPLEGCGCFGRAIPRTPSQTLAEDALLVAAAALGWLLRGGTPARRTAPAVSRPPGLEPVWKTATVLAMAVLSGAFALASPRLPLDDLVTELAPGVVWNDLGVALAEEDLSKGRWLVVLLALKEEASAASLQRLNALASAGEPVIGLYADDEAAHTEFLFTRGPAFPLYTVSPGDLKRLHRRLPRLFALVEGKVTATWAEPPTAEALHAALEAGQAQRKGNGKGT